MKYTDEAVICGVVKQFYEMCRYPHPSWGEGPLADYVEALLKKRGLCVIRDEWNNLMADVPASPGREHAPLVVLQGHLDMVCAVKPDSGYDPATSPVNCVVEDGVLRSDGNSSLGADNNLGNAAALWLMEQEIPHGPVRLLFTVAEEVGLAGSAKVNGEWLKGCAYLINTDGFSLGKAIVSSAGGLRERFCTPIQMTDRSKKTVCCVSFDQFPGGHSGYDIHRGRTNPILASAQFLCQLKEQVEYELLEWSGGHSFNAIPMDCAALLAVDEEKYPVVEQKTREFAAAISDGEVIVRRVESEQKQAWTKEFRDNVLSAVCALTVGVYAWRDEANEQVSASANLGRVGREQDTLEVDCFIRAARDEDTNALHSQHASAMIGFGVQCNGYPGWPERENNPLVNAMQKVWKGLTGQGMEVAAVHVGLEPSVLGAKNPGMCMVNTGPEILDAHSLDERAPLVGLPLYVRLLAGTLNELSK